MAVARAQGLFRARLTRLKYLAPPEPLLPPTLAKLRAVGRQAQPPYVFHLAHLLSSQRLHQGI